MVDELGGRIDGRVHLLELSNTELEARYVCKHTHDNMLCTRALIFQIGSSS